VTRINVVPVSELCDEHLRAEHRELTRIPNSIFNGKLSDERRIPSEYKLGTGHVYFFANKLGYLFDRYDDLLFELLERGFKAEDRWPSHVIPIGEYTPTKAALKINRERIKERWPKNAHYYSNKVNYEDML
jgi:hypothetical protein